MKESHGFEFKCRKNCTQPCIECFRNAFGKEPKIHESQTIVDWDEIPTWSFPNVIEDTLSLSDRSHKLEWKLPEKCHKEKCNACRNLSCCKYYGLLLFCRGLFKK